MIVPVVGRDSLWTALLSDQEQQGPRALENLMMLL